MGEFSVSRVIQAPIHDVWSRLADDIGTISQWNPGVKDSYTTNDIKYGMGATRHCDLLGNSNAVEEEVVKFDEHNHAITFRITETNLPFVTADIRFTLLEEAVVKSGSSRHDKTTTTQVTVSPIYKLKYGVIGRFLDAVVIRNTYRRGMENLLVGLQQDLETKAAVKN